MKTTLTLVILLSLLTIGNSFSLSHKRNPLHGPITQNQKLHFEKITLQVNRTYGLNQTLYNEAIMSDDEKLVVYRRTPEQINVYENKKNERIVFQADISGKVKRIQFSKHNKYLYVIMDRKNYLEFITYNLKDKSFIVSQKIEPFDDVYVFDEVNILVGRQGQFFSQYYLMKGFNFYLQKNYRRYWDVNFGQKIRFALPPKQDIKPYIYVSIIIENQQNINKTEIYLLMMKSQEMVFMKQGSTDHKYSDIQNHVFLGLNFFDVVLTTENSLLYNQGISRQVYDLGKTQCNTLERTSVFSQLSGYNQRTILCWSKNPEATEYIQFSVPTSQNPIEVQFFDIKMHCIEESRNFSGSLSKNSNYLIIKMDGIISRGFTVFEASNHF